MVKEMAAVYFGQIAITAAEIGALDRRINDHKINRINGASALELEALGRR
ncbi:hypothetical protein [Defluviimonas salinarum]|uniref:Uncharacterized protein n=1 Tax=Defluviimonas salinarum TaxID=2992147 RepID=A0ABT3JBE6_9RHOB|nr:hypothetical protein [Defluviimonas salinarum]MCW3784764.1 hypothetical protein [Defluviimonas salinarum]